MQTMQANENAITGYALAHPAKENWAAKYRQAPRTSVEGWIYLAACTIRGDETFIREVGRIAYTSGCCTWHAAWVANGKTGTCHCADCARARREGKAA